MQLKTISKILFLLTFSFLCLLNINAQNSELDSVIKATLEMPDDTNKVLTLNDLVWKIKVSDSKTAIELGEKSIALSEKIKFDKGTGYAAKNNGVVYYYSGDYENAQKYYEKALTFFGVFI